MFNLYVSARGKWMIASLLLLAGSLLAGPLPAGAVTSTATLSLSPSSQSVSSGSIATFVLMLNPGGNAINTVQTRVIYPAGSLSYVSAKAGSAFSGFVATPANGSVRVTAISTSPPSGSVPLTVATITMKVSRSTGSSVQLAGICPPANYGLNCSAAYAASNNSNVLAKLSGPAQVSSKPTARAVRITHHSLERLIGGLVVLLAVVGLVFVVYRFAKHRQTPDKQE